MPDRIWHCRHLALPPPVLPPSLCPACWCIADPFDSGSLTLAGRTPEEWGVPKWRAVSSAAPAPGSGN